MKKTIVTIILILTLAMVVSCGRTEKDVNARLSAGEKVLVTMAAPSLTNQYMMSQIEYLKQAFGEMGITFEFKTSEGDSELMITQIEDFISRGSDLIICAPTDADAVRDVLLEAKAAGIPVVLAGESPDYAEELAGGVYVDWYALGYEVGKMASAWIDEFRPDAGPGSVYAANLINENQMIYLLQNAGLMAALSEDSRISVVVTEGSIVSVEDGYIAAERSFTVDSRVTLFLCYQESAAVGASEYIMARGELESEPEDYACFAGGLGGDGKTLLEQSRQGRGALRGAVAYGIYDDGGDNMSSAECLFYAAKNALLGAGETPVFMEMDRWSVTGFKYSYVYDNTQNDTIQIANK